MKKETDTLHPPRLGKIILAVSISLFLISDISKHFLPAINYMNLANYEAKLEWYLRLGRDAGFAIAMSSMIIFGIRSIRFYGKRAKRFVAPIIGILICIALSTIGFYGSRNFEELQLIFEDSKALEKLEQAMKKDHLTLEKRSSMSKVYASSYYYSHGKQIEYLEPDGSHTLYSPTEEDKDARKNKVDVMHLMTVNQKSMNNSIYFWLIILALSLLLGLFTPISKTNQSFKPDA